jgi:hypothetical protein
MDIIVQLKIERDRVAQQVSALDAAIRALSGNTTHTVRRMSAAARARISAAQKARWARTRRASGESAAPKRRK